MNKKSGKKVNRKKAIPVYFQRSQASISQILTTANYKRRVKDLMRINKELACTLQDVRCRVADQERALAEYNRKTTQMMFVKMKIKDMATTVQKLVSDMEEVKNCMDSNLNCFLHSGIPHEEVRLRIADPGMSVIEESASRSAIEANLSTTEGSSCGNAFEPDSTEFVPEIHLSPGKDVSQTEVYSIPTLMESSPQDCLNKSQDAAARASKSAEHIDSLNSPCTPEPPPSPSFFSLKASTQSQTLLGLRKLCSSKSSPVFSKNAEKANIPTTQNSTSKIPMRKPMPVSNVCPQPSVSSDHFNRRATFVVESVQNEPQTVLSAADRRGTFTLNTFPASDHLGDRRATFVVPAHPADKPVPSPPKVIQTNQPFQAAASNETVLLCEDMELTEIIPAQSQAQQFIPSQEVLIEEMEAEECLSNKELPSSASISETVASNSTKNISDDVNFVKPNAPFRPTVLQPVCTVEPKLIKDKQIPNSVMVKERSDKRKNDASTDPLVKTRLSRSQVRGKEVEPADIVSNKNPSPKAKDLEMSTPKSSAIGKGITSVATSPSKDIQTVGVLAQSAIPHSVSKETRGTDEAVEECDSRKSSTSESCLPKTKVLEYILNSECKNALIKENSRLSLLTKKKSASKGQSGEILDAKMKRASSKDQTRASSSRPKVPETESSGSSDSSGQSRRSARKPSSHYGKFFESDSNESDVGPEEDFLHKRFSLAAGRRIVNPNNNKVFVFKNNSMQYSLDKRNSSAPMSNKSPDIEVDDSIESDVFNFSASSEADKSPAKKPKKSRKSVLRKSKKPSSKKQSIVKNKLSKESTAPVELHEKNVPVLRKSILSSNKDAEVLQPSRKSVRFTLAENGKHDESNSLPFEINLIENKSSNEIEMNEEHSSRDSKDSTGKKIPLVKKIYSSAKRSSLKATGDKLKHSGTLLKSEKSKKRRSLNSSINPLENIFKLRDNPNEKKQKDIDKETGQQLESLARLSSSRKVESNNTKSSPENEKSLNKRGKKDSDEVESGPQVNLVALDEITRSSRGSEAKGSTRGKRTFSGVSERRSKKRSTLEDDFLSDLDNSMLSCRTPSRGADAPLKFMDSEPTEVYSVKEVVNLLKPISPVSSSKQTTSERKKKITKNGKNSNLKAENCKVKKADSTMDDTITSKKILALHNKDHKPGTITKSNLKLDVLVHSNDTSESQKHKHLPSADSIHPDEIRNVRVQMEKLVIKSKPKKSRKKTTNENAALNSLSSQVEKNYDAINMQPVVALETLPALQHQCGSDLLCCTSPKAPDDTDGGRPRRSRAVKSLKEPSLNKKMRR